MPLTHYVGSNTRGRTFLFQIDGFLYQSPVNYYAARGVWDMSPGYQSLTEMELNHPVMRARHWRACSATIPIAATRSRCPKRSRASLRPAWARRRGRRRDRTARTRTTRNPHPEPRTPHPAPRTDLDMYRCSV